MTVGYDRYDAVTCVKTQSINQTIYIKPNQSLYLRNISPFNQSISLHKSNHSIYQQKLNLSKFTIQSTLRWRPPLSERKANFKNVYCL